MNQAAGNRPASLALRKSSHMTVKSKSNIKIVHIYAPEIIKTDVENFRELVQRLTGKPAKRVGGKKKAMIEAVPEPRSSLHGRCGDLLQEEGVKKELSEEENGSESCEEDISGGFLNGLEDMEGFLDDFFTDFPLLPAVGSLLSHE